MASNNPNTTQPGRGPSDYAQLSWQESSNSPKTKLPGRDPSEYPQLNWTENDFAMTYRLLDIFHEHESIRRAIWPGPDDEPSGKIKTDVHNEIALKLLKPLNNKYSECIARKEGLRFYGKSVKNRVFKLKESYNKAVERLGSAGAVLPSEESVYTAEDNSIREAWDAVRKTAPFFFRLRDVLGQHPSFLATKSNSLARPQRLTSNGRLSRRNAEEMDDEGDQSANGGLESMEEDEYIHPVTPRTDLNAGASSTVSTPSEVLTPTATGSVSAHSRSKSRKRGVSQRSDATMISFRDSLREMTEASEKRRRITEREAEVTRRHQGSQETRRLKLAAHMEMRRMEVMIAKEEKLEMRRMEIANAKEQRKHELEMKRLELLGQGVDVDRILGKTVPAAGVEAETRNNGNEPTRGNWAGQGVPGSRLMGFRGENGWT